MITFPLSLSANWQNVSSMSDLSIAEHAWLCEPHSLTAKLKSRSKCFSVKVLNEQECVLNYEQQALLKGISSSVLNREVLLLCDGAPMVYAQSWLPVNVTSANRQLLNMGEKPLGDIIFQDPALTRANIEVARFDQFHPLQQLVKQLDLPVQPVLGRRSVFTLHNYQFLVSEVFLPGAYLYS